LLVEEQEPVLNLVVELASLGELLKKSGMVLNPF
jgi:hypothetical protein